MGRLGFTVAIWLAFASMGHAGPAGTLDPSFGSSGHVVTDIPGGPERALALVLQPDGKLVVGGTVGSSTGDRFALARYAADGSLDGTFGSGGIVITDVGFGDDVVNGLALQPDGKIVAVGYGGRTAFAVVRYDVNGTLDPSFGTGGIVTTTFPGGYASAARVVVQPDGNLIVGGVNGNPAGGTTDDFALARYLPDGTLDTSFGSGGRVLTDFGFGDEIFALVRLADGRIVAGGGRGEFHLARYLADGSLDATFGSGGRVTTVPGPSYSEIRDLLELPGNQLAVTGGVGTASGTAFGLARYNGDGSLDGTFGSGGLVLTDLGLANQHSYALAQQPDGKLLVAGDAANHVAVLRYHSDGTVDTTFGTGGHVVTDAGGDYAEPVSLALQPDAKIAVASGGEFALVRYLGGTCGDGIPDAGEDCDDGNLTSGDGCDASCCTADADGDGACDANDPCTGTPVAASRPKITIRTTAKTFALAGEVVLPHPFSPPLDPPATGVRLVVTDAAGSVIDVGIPSTAFLTGMAAWTVTPAGSGTKWKFSDRTLLTPGHVRALTIQDKSAMTPGKVKFTLSAKKGMPVLGTALPLSATLVFDAPTAQTGQCAGLAFPGPPPAPSCTLDAPHNRIVCK